MSEQYQSDAYETHMIFQVNMGGWYITTYLTQQYIYQSRNIDLVLLYLYQW